MNVEVMKRFWPLILSVGIVVLCAGLCRLIIPERLVYNYTDSLPHGFYWISQKKQYGYGDLVVFPVPEHVRQLVTARGWLSQDGVLIKPVAGLAGDSCCNRQGRFLVNDQDFGTVEVCDRSGRPLPSEDCCGVIADGYLVAGVQGSGHSFDSRYFGPVCISRVIGTAVPLWTASQQKQSCEDSNSE